MKVYIVQFQGFNSNRSIEVTENIAAFNNRVPAIAYADELEENGEYPKNTLFVEEVEILG